MFLPQLGRLAAAVGLVVGQAFLSAYAREKQRLRAAAAEEEDGDGGRRRMTPLEAIQILGVEKSNPSLLHQFGSPKEKERDADGGERCAVLTRERDREVARENFERMFALAVKHENQFLAGKLSLAFRVCVDPAWDDRYDEATNSREKET